ncbi:MAG: MtnX-like HAD-IB family phosphatase [Acidobacteriota bacterium]
MLFAIDFDGTIAPTDTVDALLERFAHPDWQRIEEQWVRGEIDSRQCMAAEIALVDAGEDVLEAFLRTVPIDESFARFVHYVKQFAEVVVISDGLDYPIIYALHGAGLSIPLFANRLTFRTRGLGITFPYADAACLIGSGVCKCAAVRTMNAGRGLPTVLIGDGRSDFCIARCADYVFAKGTLRTFCEAESINHSPFDTFDDVLTVVRGWKAQRFQAAPQESECPLSPG